MFVLQLWLACGLFTSQPETITSHPSEPIADLQGEGPIRYTMVWSDLAEMFPERPGMVRPLDGLVPGAPAQEARALLVASKAERAKVEEYQVDGHRAIGTMFRHGGTDVGATLVLDEPGQTLRTVDLRIDWAAASAVLVERWGEPERAKGLKGGWPSARWMAGPWVAELHRLPGGAGILQFRAPGTP